jgi:hypothetical protein
VPAYGQAESLALRVDQRDVATKPAVPCRGIAGDDGRRPATPTVEDLEFGAEQVERDTRQNSSDCCDDAADFRYLSSATDRADPDAKSLSVLHIDRAEWISTHGPQEIADKLPADYDYQAGGPQGYVKALTDSMGMFTKGACCKVAQSSS